MCEKSKPGDPSDRFWLSTQLRRLIKDWALGVVTPQNGSESWWQSLDKLKIQNKAKQKKTYQPTLRQQRGTPTGDCEAQLPPWGAHGKPSPDLVSPFATMPAAQAGTRWWSALHKSQVLFWERQVSSLPGLSDVMAERKWKQIYDQRRNHLSERPQEAATAAGWEHFVEVENAASEEHALGFQSPLCCARAVWP